MKKILLFTLGAAVILAGAWLVLYPGVNPLDLVMAKKAIDPAPAPAPVATITTPATDFKQIPFSPLQLFS